MKRSDALIPLSHDHQHGLDAALGLRRATGESSSEAASCFLAFWEKEGAHHFEVEESVLLGALPPTTPGWQDRVARVRSEHADIRARAAALQGREADPDALRELGDRLHDHIRFEERELFPEVEATLDPDELARLAAAIASAHG